MADIKALAEAVLQRNTAPKYEQTITVENRPEDLKAWRHTLSDLPLLNDDWRFIARNMMRLNAAQRVKAATQYKETWMHAADQEPITFRKNNRARRTANTWLRQYREGW